MVTLLFCLSPLCRDTARPRVTQELSAEPGFLVTFEQTLSLRRSIS